MELPNSVWGPFSKRTSVLKTPDFPMPPEEGDAPSTAWNKIRGISGKKIRNMKRSKYLGMEANCWWGLTCRSPCGSPHSWLWTAGPRGCRWKRRRIPASSCQPPAWTAAWSRPLIPPGEGGLAIWLAGVRPCLNQVLWLWRWFLQDQIVHFLDRRCCQVLKPSFSSETGWLSPCL